MTKDLKKRKFNIWTFIDSLIVIAILTTVSFFASWAKDEGQITEESGVIKNFIADSFYLFAFPTLHLFWDTIIKNSSKLFLPALAFNVMFWTIVTERLITISTRIIRNRRLKSNVR